MNLSILFTSQGLPPLDNHPGPTYIAIINRKDGTITTKCLNPTRRRSSSSSSSLSSSSTSSLPFSGQPLKKRLVDSSFFLPKLRNKHRRRSVKDTKLDVHGTLFDLKYYLPLEIIQDIISYLDYYSILALSSTSRYYRQLCQDDLIWYYRFTQDFHTPSSSMLATSRTTLHTHYLALYRNHCTLARRWLEGEVQTQYLQGHEDSVYCLARVGSYRLISGSRDCSLKLWDLTPKQQQLPQQTKRRGQACADDNSKTAQQKIVPIMTKKAAHDGSVLCLRVSQDNQTMLSGSSDATCILWCLKTLQPLHVLRGHSHGVLDICIVGNEYYVSASRDHTLCVWDASSLRRSQPGDKMLHRLLGHLGPVNALDVYDDNHVVSASGDGTLKLWNIRKGHCIKTFQDTENSGADQHYHGLACVKCDSQRGLIYSGGQNGKLKVWDAYSGQCVASLSGHHGLIRTMDLMRGGKILVTGSYDRTVRVWDLLKRQCILSFQSGHQSWIFNLLVTRSHIISAGQDKQIMMLDFGKGLTPLDD